MFWCEILKELDSQNASLTLESELGDKYYSFNIRYLTEDGRYNFYITDITNHKQAQHLLESAKEMTEQKFQVRTKFFANMSHEIRTPMNAILGFSELLLETELNKKQHSFVDNIYRSTDHLLSLINNVLDFTECEDGSLHLKYVDFHLDELLQDVINLLEMRAKQKGIELTYVGEFAKDNIIMVIL